MRVSTRALLLGGVIGGSVLVAPAMALADEPVYPPAAPPTTVTQVLGETVAQPVAQPVPAVAAAATVATPSASLPFTGLDTMALVSAGVVLIAGGSALTVASRRRRSGSAS